MGNVLVTAFIMKNRGNEVSTVLKPQFQTNVKSNFCDFLLKMLNKICLENGEPPAWQNHFCIFLMLENFLTIVSLVYRPMFQFEPKPAPRTPTLFLPQTVAFYNTDNLKKDILYKNTELCRENCGNR